MGGSNHEPEVGTRTSFVEPRVAQDPFFRVPSMPEPNGNAVGQNSAGVGTFNPGVGLQRPSRRTTPRKAPTPFRAAQPSQQQPVSPPLQEKQPAESAPFQFFVFKAAGKLKNKIPRFLRLFFFPTNY